MVIWTGSLESSLSIDRYYYGCSIMRFSGKPVTGVREAKVQGGDAHGRDRFHGGDKN